MLCGSWLVGCFGFTALWGSISVYIRQPPKERERKRRERIDEIKKNVQTTPTCTCCKRSRPLPYCNPNCRTPRHWKFTQHHRTDRPPPCAETYAQAHKRMPNVRADRQLDERSDGQTGRFEQIRWIQQVNSTFKLIWEWESKREYLVIWFIYKNDLMIKEK